MNGNMKAKFLRPMQIILEFNNAKSIGFKNIMVFPCKCFVYTSNKMQYVYSSNKKQYVWPQYSLATGRQMHSNCSMLEVSPNEYFLSKYSSIAIGYTSTIKLFKKNKNVSIKTHIQSKMESMAHMYTSNNMQLNCVI